MHILATECHPCRMFPRTPGSSWKGSHPASTGTRLRSEQPSCPICPPHSSTCRRFPTMSPAGYPSCQPRWNQRQTHQRNQLRWLGRYLQGHRQGAPWLNHWAHRHHQQEVLLHLQPLPCQIPQRMPGRMEKEKHDMLPHQLKDYVWWAPKMQIADTLDGLLPLWIPSPSAETASRSASTLSSWGDSHRMKHATAHGTPEQASWSSQPRLQQRQSCPSPVEGAATCHPRSCRHKEGRLSKSTLMGPQWMKLTYHKKSLGRRRPPPPIRP